jgi:uncharacterized protein (DUF1330 family)
MSAYVFIDIDVHDPVVYEEYKKAGATTIIAYGGKPLVRGPRVEVAEGDWQPKRLVLLEFEDMAQAKRWWNSPEYNEAKKLRHKAASANVVFFEGL